jgi:hypothetical protein
LMSFEMMFLLLSFAFVIRLLKVEFVYFVRLNYLFYQLQH